MKRFLKFLCICILFTTSFSGIPLIAEGAGLDFIVATPTEFLAAFDAARSNIGGGNITLTADITLSGDLELITADDSPIAILTDEYSIIITAEIPESSGTDIYIAGSITISGGKAFGGVVEVKDHSTLTMDSGVNIFNSHDWSSGLSAEESSFLIIAGGRIIAGGTGGKGILSNGIINVHEGAEIEGTDMAIFASGSNAKVNIFGGSFKSTGAGGSTIYISNEGELYLDGGSIITSGTSSSSLSVTNKSMATIEAGSMTNSIYGAISVTDNSNVEINGGTFTGGYGVVSVNGNSLLTITGGTISTTNYSGIAIEASANSNVSISGNPTITGGDMGNGLEVGVGCHAYINENPVIRGGNGVMAQGEICIEGGLIEGSNSNGISLINYGDIPGSITIKGGVIRGNVNGVMSVNSTVVIYGGEVGGNNNGLLTVNSHTCIYDGYINGGGPTFGIGITASSGILEIINGDISGGQNGISIDGDAEVILYNGIISATGTVDPYSIYRESDQRLYLYSAVQLLGDTMFNTTDNLYYRQSFDLTPKTIQITLGQSTTTSFNLTGEVLDGQPYNHSLEDILGSSGATLHTTYNVVGNYITFTPIAVGSESLFIEDILTYNSQSLQLQISSGGGTPPIVNPPIAPSESVNPAIVGVNWEIVKANLLKAKAGAIVKVNMLKESLIPSHVLESFKGRDVGLQLTMENGVTWTIDGETIRAGEIVGGNINLGVKAVRNSNVSALVEGNDIIQLRLNHGGEFPFIGVLNIPVDKAYVSRPAYLYWVKGPSELEYKGRVRVNESGVANISFKKGGDYVVSAKIIKDIKVIDCVSDLDSVYLNTLLPYYFEGDDRKTVNLSGIIDGYMHFMPRVTAAYDYINIEMEFADIDNHANSDAISFVAARELFNGVANGRFAPDNTMTRGMFVTVFGRLLGLEPSNYKACRFEDVKENIYYAPYVEWAAANGIVNGVGDNKFAPDKEISRQEMMVMVKRFIDYLKLDLAVISEDGLDSIYEGKISGWAKASVNSMFKYGLISYEIKNLNPLEGAARWEVADVIKILILNMIK